MKFRAIIQAEAKRQNLSGYALAKLSGVPLRTTQRYLADVNDLAGENVALLAAALGLELRPVRKSTKGKVR